MIRRSYQSLPAIIILTHTRLFLVVTLLIGFFKNSNKLSHSGVDRIKACHSNKKQEPSSLFCHYSRRNINHMYIFHVAWCSCWCSILIMSSGRSLTISIQYKHLRGTKLVKILSGIWKQNPITRPGFIIHPFNCRRERRNVGYTPQTDHFQRFDGAHSPTRSFIIDDDYSANKDLSCSGGTSSRGTWLSGKWHYCPGSVTVTHVSDSINPLT